MNTRLRKTATVSIALAVMLTPLAATAANGTLREIESAFIEIGKTVRPVVVNIDVERKTPEPMGGMGDMNIQGLEEFFRFFGRPMPNMPIPQPIPQPGPQQRMLPRPVASGSGFIYDASGHIVTNNHVIADGEIIKVRLWNGNVYEASVVGTDPQSDLAVIKIDAEETLPVAKLGNSDTLQVGQYAIAVGSPQGLEGSLSFGHVTALGRDRQDNIVLPDIRFLNFIQTDAAINLGNSGGPLCNIDGEVIGVNVAIVRFADALGFAIPVNMVHKVVPTLIAEGKVTRGYLGVSIRDAREFREAANLPDDKGAFVHEVVDGAPAAEAGIKVYDVIRKVNGEPVNNATDLQYRISDMMPGDTALLEVFRDGKTLELSVTLAEFPDDTAVAVLGPSTLGMRIQPLTQEAIGSMGLDEGTKGVIVAQVDPDGIAARSGIIPGDVIIEIAKQPVDSPETFRNIVRQEAQPGRSVLVRLIRQGASMPIILSIKVPETSGE